MALDRDGEVCSAQCADSETGERSSHPAEDEAVIAFWKSTLVGSKRKQSNEQKPAKCSRGRPKKHCLTLQECLSSLVETSEKVFPSGNTAPANTADTISSCTESKQHQRKRPKCLLTPVNQDCAVKEALDVLRRTDLCKWNIQVRCSYAVPSDTTGVQATATRFGLTRDMLHHPAKRVRALLLGNEPLPRDSQKPNRGRKPLLAPEVEKQICLRVTHMAKIGQRSERLGSNNC
jgi:hypothetical protein